MLKRFLLIRGTELVAFALLCTIPLLTSNSYALGLLTLLAIYGILLIGLDVTVGYLGQVNLAHAAFLGLGAYAAGLSVSLLGFGMFAALAAGLAVGLVFGGLLAFPALRLEGPQFALATLSFSALSVTTLNELESLTGGAQGLSVNRPAVFGHAVDAAGLLLALPDPAGAGVDGHAQPAFLAMGARLRSLARQPDRHRCHGRRHLSPQSRGLCPGFRPRRLGRRALRLQFPVFAAATASSTN